MLHHHLHFLTRFMRHGAQTYQYVKGMIDVNLVRLRRGGPRALGSRQLGKHLSQKRPLLIHYHIYKNAGTSFEWTLEKSFDGRFRRYDCERPGDVLSQKNITRYVKSASKIEVISSHQATLPPPKIAGREVISSILIRDPIARIRSIYAFERRQQINTPGAIKAKELDFKGYVEWRLATSPATLCNFQVHFCSRSKGVDSNSLDSAAKLRKAINNLDQVDIVGTVARYNEWLALVQVVLSEKFPGISLAVTRQNATELNRETVTEANILDNLVREVGHTLADHLLQANELDMSLHQIADASLTRRLAEHGVDNVLRSAYADARKRTLTDVVDSLSDTA